MGNKVNHIPVCLTAETMEAPVNLHAGVFIVMEGADAHPVSSYPDTVMLGGLPGETDCFTASNTFNRQILLKIEKAPAILTKKRQAPDWLKFHILFLLAAGLLAFLFFPLFCALNLPA